MVLVLAWSKSIIAAMVRCLSFEEGSGTRGSSSGKEIMESEYG
jgi:hypothetical protein